MNAAAKSYPGTKVNGCYSHLTQNLWRHMQKNGLSDAYCTGKTVYWAFQWLKCLPFVPANSVIDAFNEIKSKSPSSFESMPTYFETYYIGNLKTNSKSIRQEPMFPITLWNVYDRVFGDLARTTNSVEVWHKNLENDCKKHPNLETSKG